MSRGKVILAGAGPGDPDLITMKALRWIEHADVIIVDRLVSEELITQHAKANAVIIPVGKQAGKSDSAAQEDINQLLVEYSANYLVVRLKGGDVSFFSNVLDELRTLVEHGIPYEIVPGVTAASGASAYAGIPLTARGYASAVRFLTFHSAASWDERAWKDLAHTSDTLVFYMSSKGIASLVDQLKRFDVAPEKSIAVVEQATTPFQRVTTCRIARVSDLLSKSFESPAIVIIGYVASLHEQFQWIENNPEAGTYFRPVEDHNHLQLSSV